MKLIKLTFVLCILMCACTSSKEEPNLEYSIAITTEEPKDITIDGATVNISLNHSGIQIKECGIEIYEGMEVINTQTTHKVENTITFEITSLIPNSSYSIKSYVLYIDPNNKEEKTRYGNMVSFRTLSPIIEISSLNTGSNIVNGTVISYSEGECSVEIKTNLSSSDKITLYISRDKNFENIAIEKVINRTPSPTTLNFNLEQGKYYGQCTANINGQEIYSNIVEYYVIKHSGTVVTEGYVDLGFDYLWSASYYTDKLENGSQKFTFPVSTISDFEGINLNNDNFSGTQYDYITVNLGESYRIPTFSEFLNLLTACLVEYNEDEIKISGCTGNAISIPKYFENNNFNYIGSYYLGTGTLSTPVMAWSFHYSSSGLGEWPSQNLNNSFVIYPVKDKE